MSNKNNNKVQISRKRKLTFNIILTLFSVLIIALLELGLKLANYGEDLSLFVKSTNYPGYLEINQKVNLRYFSKVGKTSGTSDIFLENKPDTCFRIFVFGGSTTRGFPYNEGVAFPRILYYQLQDAYPTMRIEVINLSASAINSFTYIDMADEVLDQEPDAVLVYGGHNEYYGAMGVSSIENGDKLRWLKKVRLRLGKLRSFQLVQNIIKKFAAKQAQKTQPSATLMARIVKDKDIFMDSPEYESGITQFQSNLTELIKKCKKKDIPIILSDLVSNVQGMQPFYSDNNEGKGKARDVFYEADSKYKNKEFEKAAELYTLAKDLDVIRFRAPEAFNNVIYKLGKEYNIPIVKMSESFQSKSEHQLIGYNLMTDHLHPNIDGYFLMSDAFFNKIIDEKIISDKEPRKIVPISDYRNNWGFTALDSLIGDFNIKYLEAGWPFQEKNEGDLYLATYRSKGIVDSLALSYVMKTEDRHIEDEHIKLGVYFGKIGLYNEAFKEYYSIIKMHPYIMDLYFDASRYLIKQHKYQQALDLINSSPLKIKDHYYYYMIGTLELRTGRIENSIKHLNLARELITPQYNILKTLKPLYYAYSANKDSINSNKLLEIIRKTEPTFQRNDGSGYVYKKEISLNELYKYALQFYQKGNLEKALEILLSVGDKADFDIKRLTGFIYLKQNKYPEAFEYCKAAFDLNPNHIGNLNSLFILFIAKNDFTAAWDMLSRMESQNMDVKKLESLKALYTEKYNAYNNQ